MQRSRFYCIILFLDLTQIIQNSYFHSASSISKSTLSFSDYVCNADRQMIEERFCEYFVATKRSGIPMPSPYTEIYPFLNGGINLAHIH